MFTALGIGKSAQFPLRLILMSHASIHRQSVCVYSLGISRRLKPVHRAELRAWSRYTSLIVSSDFHVSHTRLLLSAWQPVTCIGLGSGVVADALIAITMCWSLYHKRTGFARQVKFSPFALQAWLSFVRRTDSIIMTLMSYSINSGVLTW